MSGFHYTLEWMVASVHTMLEMVSCWLKYGRWYYTSTPPMVNKNTTVLATDERNIINIAQRNDLITSFWLSIYEWYTKLSRSLVPDILKNSCQKWLMKMGSQSLTMDLGIPWSLIMPSTNFTATVFAVDGWRKVRK